MKYVFLPEAREEFLKEIEYFEECRKGLGQEFSKEVFSAIQRIINFPDAWTKLSKNTRRALTNRFPFGVIYHIDDEMIVVVAVMQLIRDPDYWKNR